MLDVTYPKTPQDKLKVVLKKPLVMTPDDQSLRIEVKRALRSVLKERAIFGYSGGLDSSFVLCCLRELVTGGRVDPSKFQVKKMLPTINGISVQRDHERAIRFANSLGFHVAVEKVELTEKIQDYADFGDKHLIPCIVSITQEVWRQSQDLPVIKAANHPGMSVNWLVPFSVLPRDSSHYIDGSIGSMQHSEKLMHHELSPTIDIFEYDERVYSAFLSPFYMSYRDIDQTPFTEDEKSLGNPFSVSVTNSMLFKWIRMLNCYPEMQQIYFKFPTFENGGKNKEISKLRKYLLDRYKECSMSLLLNEDGTVWEKQQAMQAVDELVFIE